MHQFYSLCSQIIGGIVVCLLIISFSVTLTLNFRPLYYADIQNLHITEFAHNGIIRQGRKRHPQQLRCAD